LLDGTKADLASVLANFSGSGENMLAMADIIAKSGDSTPYGG